MVEAAVSALAVAPPAAKAYLLPTGETVALVVEGGLLTAHPSVRPTRGEVGLLVVMLTKVTAAVVER
jgi:hypothetical protein